MYVYVYVCMYVYICIPNTYAHHLKYLVWLIIYMYICVYIYTYIHTYIYICIPNTYAHQWKHPLLQCTYMHTWYIRSLHLTYMHTWYIHLSFKAFLWQLTYTHTQHIHTSLDAPLTTTYICTYTTSTYISWSPLNYNLHMHIHNTHIHNGSTFEYNLHIRIHNTYIHQWIHPSCTWQRPSVGYMKKDCGSSAAYKCISGSVYEERLRQFSGI